MKNIFNKAIEVSYALFDKKKLLFDQRCFVVCCAFYKNKLIVIETNSNKTDPINLRNPLICRRTGQIIKKERTCAEWNTIKRLKNTTNLSYNKISLVNVRITRQGKLGLSRCCSSCSQLISFIEPKNVFYTLDSERNNPVFEKYYE